jgi:exopolyphosphatase/guanosine-5'-triphosphate,3'-diphosphate pyrophosphatase
VENRRRRRLQLAVCALSDIAWRDHPGYRASFAFDRTIEYPFFGIDHMERAFIALTIYLRYGGKPSDKRVSHIGSLLSKRAIRRAETLGFGLRLAYRISGGNPRLLEQSRLEIKDDQLSLILPDGGAAPMYERVARSFERLCQARKIKMGPITEAKEPATGKTVPASVLAIASAGQKSDNNQTLLAGRFVSIRLI